MDRLAAQTNDQLDTKQEIQWVGKPIRETYLDQLVGRQVGPPPSEAALPGQPALGSLEIAPPVARLLWPISRQPMVRPPCGPSAGGPSARTPSARTPSARGPSAQSSHSPVVVPSSPARLGLARSNPLTPGTSVRPARYPDRPEPIKLNYQKYNNAHWTRWRSCGGVIL